MPWTPRETAVGQQEQQENTRSETETTAQQKGARAMESKGAYAFVGKETQEMMKENEELTNAVNNLLRIAQSVAKDMNAQGFKMDKDAMVVNARKGDDNKTFLNISIKTDDGYAFLNASQDGKRLTSVKAEGNKAQEVSDFLATNRYLASDELNKFVETAKEITSKTQDVYVTNGANNQGKQFAVIHLQNTQAQMRIEVGDFVNDKGKTCPYARAVDYKNRDENGHPTVTYIKSPDDLKKFEGRISEEAMPSIIDCVALYKGESFKAEKTNSGADKPNDSDKIKGYTNKDTNKYKDSVEL